MIWKAKPRCPECGAPLSKNQKGYSCLNPECKVCKVFFDRNLKIRKVTYEGIDYMKMFDREP